MSTVHPAMVGHDVDHLAAADAADVDGRMLVQLRAAPTRTAAPGSCGRARTPSAPRCRPATGWSRARHGPPPRRARPGRPSTARRSRGWSARRRRRTRPVPLGRQERRRLGQIRVLLDSSSGTISSFTLTPGISSRACDRSASAANPRQAALHVVGAATVQPPVHLPRRELLAAGGDDVHVGVPDQRDRALADRRHDRGQSVHLVGAVGDALPLQPSLEEPHRRLHAVGLRAVVGDQPLCEGEFVGSGHEGDCRLHITLDTPSLWQQQRPGRAFSRSARIAGPTSALSARASPEHRAPGGYSSTGRRDRGRRQARCRRRQRP